MPETPLGYILYPSAGDTSWFEESEDGLEAWLKRAEALSLPTYDTFSSLPPAADTTSFDPSASQPQRQLALVADEDTVYRADPGTDSWNAVLSLDHSNLTNIASDAHHTKTSSASELADVSADSEADAHHTAHTHPGDQPLTDDVTDDNATTYIDYSTGETRWEPVDEIAYITSEEGVRRYQTAELEDTESHEVPVTLAGTETLEVYRWGAYTVGDPPSAPAGLTAEIADASGTALTSESTTDTTQTGSPVASYENTTGGEVTVVLRAYNGTGGALDSPGVGMHFGFRVV